jgi:hypothetical protein
MHTVHLGEVMGKSRTRPNAMDLTPGSNRMRAKCLRIFMTPTRFSSTRAEYTSLSMALRADAINRFGDYGVLFLSRAVDMTQWELGSDTMMPLTRSTGITLLW